jgi:hypothetical protein
LLKLPPLKPEDIQQLGGYTDDNNPLVDPSTQQPPETPNLVEQLAAEQEAAEENQNKTELEKRFDSKVTDLKSKLIPGRKSTTIRRR